MKIYQNVTIGRKNIWEDSAEDFQGFLIDEGAILCAGSKILGSSGRLRIGKNAIVGANAVVTHSIPDDAIVAGVPARIIGYRNSSEYISQKGKS